jgi:4-carboxymuconolactone decarboxylase
MSSEREKGLALIERMWGTVPGIAQDQSPLIAETVDHVFGRIWQRPGLAVEDRSFATVAVLIALNREAELRMHLTAARRLGHSDARLEELILHVAHYAGWPCAISALRALREVQKAEAGA